MSKRIDRIGRKYSRLLVVDQIFNVKGRTVCVVECDCGVIKQVAAECLDRGTTISCGCYNTENRITHGMSDLPEYKVYGGMKNRCYDEGNSAYHNYGGRGITVSESWLQGFEFFIEDMGPRPSDKHTLERVDVNLGYSKENCIWTDDRGLQTYNSRKRSNNKSGKTGVCWYEASQSWSVEIKKDKIKYFLGYYKDLATAISVREQAELEHYGFIKE